MILAAVLGILAQAATPAQDSSKEPADSAGSFSAVVYAYRIPDDRDYLQPTVTADLGRLHLEGRYNYEDRDTGSVWIGANLSAGDALKLEFTPMLGGVFGRTSGIAPGFRASLTAWALELSTEWEYVVDFRDLSGSFLYTWTEATLSPVEELHLGLVIQRTKVYETKFDVQRGVLVRLTLAPVEITGCVFNPLDRPIYVLAIGVNF